MIRRPPRSTLDRSSAASDVYKRQVDTFIPIPPREVDKPFLMPVEDVFSITGRGTVATGRIERGVINSGEEVETVSYTHLRAHETVLDLVCRLLLEKKKQELRLKQYFLVYTTININ